MNASETKSDKMICNRERDKLNQATDLRAMRGLRSTKTHN